MPPCLAGTREVAWYMMRATFGAEVGYASHVSRQRTGAFLPDPIGVLDQPVHTTVSPFAASEGVRPCWSQAPASPPGDVGIDQADRLSAIRLCPLAATSSFRTVVVPVTVTCPPGAWM